MSIRFEMILHRFLKLLARHADAEAIDRHIERFDDLIIRLLHLRRGEADRPGARAVVVESAAGLVREEVEHDRLPDAQHLVRLAPAVWIAAVPPLSEDHAFLVEIAIEQGAAHEAFDRPDGERHACRIDHPIAVGAVLADERPGFGKHGGGIGSDAADARQFIRVFGQGGGIEQRHARFAAEGDGGMGGAQMIDERDQPGDRPSPVQPDPPPRQPGMVEDAPDQIDGGGQAFAFMLCQQFRPAEIELRPDFHPAFGGFLHLHRVDHQQRGCATPPDDRAAADRRAVAQVAEDGVIAFIAQDEKTVEIALLHQ